MPEKLEDQRDALRKLFNSYITAKPEIVATQVNALVQRLGPRVNPYDDGGFSSDGSMVSHESTLNSQQTWQFSGAAPSFRSQFQPFPGIADM